MAPDKWNLRPAPGSQQTLGGIMMKFPALALVTMLAATPVLAQAAASGGTTTGGGARQLLAPSTTTRIGAGSVCWVWAGSQACSAYAATTR